MIKTACSIVILALATFPALAQNVKITPIGSHPGELRPLARTAAVIRELKAPAHLAISGRTMEFDGEGRCVAGC